jgi:aldose 1-epimerase
MSTIPKTHTPFWVSHTLVWLVGPTDQLGAIVGRYANRIRNGTFELNGNEYQIPTNDNDGLDTLHGGFVGYDQRNFTVVASNDTSITFSLLDAGFENFPGTVLTLVTYAVGSAASGPQGQVRPRFTASITAHALDEPTPIMLSTHIYWNLNAFKAQTILNDTSFYMPYADRWIPTDSILIPTGELGTTASEPALDFTTPKTVGEGVAQAEGLCGANCTGIDNAFIFDRPAYVGADTYYPIFSMWSTTTGIQLDISSNQQGLQIYTCNGQDGTIPVKQSQQDRNTDSPDAAQYVEQYGCAAVEPQNYIDAINHPEWGQDKYQIFSPSTGPYVWYATHDFSTF